MIFGRGGVGGVINRVTRQADWGQAREASLQFGSWDNRRFTADVGRGLNDTGRFARPALYENSDSYRDGVDIERYGFNPTAGLPPEPEHDGPRQLRVLPRRARRRSRHLVVQGAAGRDRPGTFFGDPAQSPADATVNLRLGAARAPVRAARHAQESH